MHEQLALMHFISAVVGAKCNEFSPHCSSLLSTLSSVFLHLTSRLTTISFLPLVCGSSQKSQEACNINWTFTAAVKQDCELSLTSNQSDPRTNRCPHMLFYSHHLLALSIIWAHCLHVDIYNLHFTV